MTVDETNVEVIEKEVIVEKPAAKQEFPVIDEPQTKKHRKWAQAAERAGIVKGADNNGDEPKDTPAPIPSGKKVKVSQKIIDNIIPNAIETPKLTKEQKIKELNGLDYMANDIRDLTDEQINDILETKVRKGEKKKDEPVKETKVINIDPNKDKLSKLGYSEEDIEKLKPEQKESIIKDAIKKPVLNTLDAMNDDEKEIFSNVIKDKKEDKKDAAPKDDTKKVDEKKPDDETSMKAKNWDKVVANPLLKSIIEYVDSGKTDLNEFIQTSGIKDVNKLSMEDMIREQCSREGFADAELDEAVEAEMADYESKTPLAKRSYEKTLRETFKKEQEELLTKFKTPVNPEIEEYNKIVNKAKSDINTTLKENLNKKMKGEVLPITESMVNDPKFVETVQFFTRLFGAKVKDGKIEGFEVSQDIIGMAMSALYRKDERAELYNIVNTRAAEEFFKERIRPADKSDGGGIAPSLIDNLTPEQRQAAIRNHAKSSRKRITA